MFWRWRSTVLTLMNRVRGDVFRGLRLGDQLQHLELARSQDVELLLATSAAGDVVANERRYRRRVEERSPRIADRQASTMSVSAPDFST